MSELKEIGYFEPVADKEGQYRCVIGHTDAPIRKLFSSIWPIQEKWIEGTPEHLNSVAANWEKDAENSGRLSLHPGGYSITEAFARAYGYQAGILRNAVVGIEKLEAIRTAEPLPIKEFGDPVV